MADSYEIREMTNDDYEEVIQIWKNAEGIAISKDDERESIKKYLLHNPGMSFVAVYKGELVGTVLAGHDSRRGYLHHLVVIETHRKKGLARLLVESCLQRLMELGINKCHVFVLAENEKGAAFWMHEGWHRRTDISIMSKNL